MDYNSKKPAKKQIPPPHPRRDYETIADDHRKITNANQRVYDAEESMMKCIEIRAKQDTMQQRREHRLVYELIEKKALAAELEKANEEKEKEEEEREKQQRERIKDEKLRQKLRRESIELREVAAKLDVAFVNKVRLGQIAEREANKKAQAAQAEFDRARIIEDSVAENRASQEARLAKTESAYKLKCELESQLIEKEQNRQVAYEQFLEEKKLIDDVVNKIKMEDQLRRENEYKRIQEHRQFIGNKEIENEELKKEQQRQHDEEERRNREFEEEIRQRQAEVKRKRDDKFDNMLKCQAELSEKLTALKTDSSEYDNMIMNLVLAEHEEKEKQKEQDLAEKLIRMRRELREGHHDQMRQKRDRALQDQENENKLRDKMMAKFAEDDRLELMNAQKRRMRQLQHKREIEHLLEERRQKLRDERDEAKRELLAEREEEQQRAKMIEEERVKMIEKVSHDLLGYMPKGIIRTYDDLEPLGNDYKEAYRPKSPGPGGDN